MREIQSSEFSKWDKADHYDALDINGLRIGHDESKGFFIDAKLVNSYDETAFIDSKAKGPFHVVAYGVDTSEFLFFTEFNPSNIVSETDSLVIKNVENQFGDVFEKKHDTPVNRKVLEIEDSVYYRLYASGNSDNNINRDCLEFSKYVKSKTNDFKSLEVEVSFFQEKHIGIFSGISNKVYSVRFWDLLDKSLCCDSSNIKNRLVIDGL